MDETTEQHTPSERQRKYLGRLLAKAHEHGVPYLPTEPLTRAQVSAWIDYLKTVVVDEEGEPTGSSPYLGTPSREPAPDGCRPACQEVSAVVDHEHMFDCYLTEEVYCTVCGGKVVGLITHHNLPVIQTIDREDGIDWSVWVCACGCGSWGARWFA